MKLVAFTASVGSLLTVVRRHTAIL